MRRETLEKFQALIYLAAIGCGMVVGTRWPEQAGTLEELLWPVLALLLYTTFTQVPLAHLREAIADTRFIQSALAGNFVLIPLMLWLLTPLLPQQPAARLGVLMVLLTPCTDWFITFTHLGKGDTQRAIAFAPLSLLLQMILLPLYLSLFLGEGVTVSMARQEVLVAFAGIILLPLLAAFVTQQSAERGAQRRALLTHLGWAPIPLLSIVVFIIAATQVTVVIGVVALLEELLALFAGFLVMAGLLARILAGLFKLPPAQGRTLAFSFGTRNSFVALPLALALPPAFELAVVAIVYQSLVELIGMIVYLWLAPRWLFPEGTRGA